MYRLARAYKSFGTHSLSFNLFKEHTSQWVLPLSPLAYRSTIDERIV